MSERIYINKEGCVMAPVTTPTAVIFAPTGAKTVTIKDIAIPQLKSKMPLLLWQQMIGFFLWSQKTHSAEAQVSWFINNETGEWLVVPFFQEGIGLTTKEIEGPENVALWADIRARGFGPNMIGTSHHHCTSPAFQSSTDSDDEMKNKTAGFHVTIGKLNQSPLDLHVRCKVVVTGEFNEETGEITRKGASYMKSFDILDLVEIPLPDETYQDMTEALQKSLMEHFLLRKEEYEFPEEWKARFVKKLYQPQQQQVQYQHRGNNTYVQPSFIRRPSAYAISAYNRDYPFDDIIEWMMVLSGLGVAGRNRVETLTLFEKYRVTASQLIESTQPLPATLILSMMELAAAVGYEFEDDSTARVVLEAFRIVDEVMFNPSITIQHLPFSFFNEMQTRVWEAMYESGLTFSQMNGAYTNNKAFNICKDNKAFHSTGILALSLHIGEGAANLLQRMYDSAFNDFKDKGKRPYPDLARNMVLDEAPDDVISPAEREEIAAELDEASRQAGELFGLPVVEDGDEDWSDGMGAYAGRHWNRP